MKNFIKTILLIALFMAAAQPARADVEEGTIVDPAIVAPLMAWVEQMTGVKVPVLPQVIASKTRLMRAAGSKASMGGRVQAAYVPGTVLMDHNRWDAEEATQISLLVHELVHHAQLFGKRTWACGDAREGQAYTLQNQWLEEQGHYPFVKASWVARMSSCGDQTASAPSTFGMGG